MSSSVYEKCQSLQSGKAIYDFLLSITPNGKEEWLKPVKELADIERIYGSSRKTQILNILQGEEISAFLEDLVANGESCNYEIIYNALKSTPIVKDSPQLKTVELWSWLKQNSRRHLFHSQIQANLSIDEYMKKVQEKITTNGVPAVITPKKITWDRSNVSRVDYFIEPSTNVANPLSCLLQFNHVGQFTFVEEKTFVTPPDLPEVPQKKRDIDTKNQSFLGMLLLYGILAIIIGLVLMMMNGGLGFALLIAGGVMVFFGYSSSQSNRDNIEYNRKCEEQEYKWRMAWEKWQNTIFYHSFQEDINGQLSRIFDSVFDCVKQVNEEVFGVKDVLDQSDSKGMNELEQQIARRKDDYR